MLPDRMMKMRQRPTMGSQGHRMQFSARVDTCHPASLGAVTLLEILVLLQRSILQNLLLHLQELPAHTQKEASLPSSDLASELRKICKLVRLPGWEGRHSAIRG